MDDGFHRIRDPSQLADLSVRRLMSWRAPAPVAIQAAGTPSERVRAWERRLGGLQSACGCEQGAVGMFVGLLGYLAYLLMRPGGWGDPGSAELWTGFAVLCVTTSVGKAVGLRLAQQRLQQAAREIRAQWTSQREQIGDPSRESSRGSRGAALRTTCCGAEPQPRRRQE